MLLSWNLLVAGQNAKAAAFFHAREILLSFLHVGIDLVHALLDPVKLFCDHASSK